jgi:di/tricarboxylate transporter
MTSDQIQLFSLFAVVFLLLIWGRWRYDLVAFSALVVAMLLGLVSVEEGFAGFGHPATLIVALVLIVSRGLVNSGAIDIITRNVVDTSRSVGGHIAMMAGVGGILSAFMNNVAAMALLMPVDVQASNKAGRPVGQTLMPLSFATILGGMITLIGTPPNIIIASYREDALGEPFGMFDFSPVGATVALVGCLYVALGGWRLIPDVSRNITSAPGAEKLEGYLAELVVPEDSSVIGRKVRDLYQLADDHDVAIIGVVRNGSRMSGFSASVELRPDDILIVEAYAPDIDSFRGTTDLEFFGERPDGEKALGDLTLIEVVVPRDSRFDGRSAISMRLRSRQGVALVGISRQGRRFKNRVRHEEVRAGDILLLLGPADRLSDVTDWLGVLPLAKRGLMITQHRRAWLAVGIFAAAIVSATFFGVYLAAALAAVVVAYLALDIVPIRNVYDHVEWPVIVLLGSMIPLGTALEESGGTELLAVQIVTVTEGFPVWLVLGVLMVVIMTLSDVLNNTATAVIGAPIAVEIAAKLNANPDPFLMAVAIAASCAFLTPIGHKNNTLILGPGGYSFGDYWPMGLPLEILVILVSVPALLFFFQI